MANQPLNAQRNVLRRRGPRTGLVFVIATVLSASVSLAPPALADAVANLSDAVAQARAGTSCGPLHANPIAEQVAQKFTQKTEDWLNHTGTDIPPEDPLPGLKILGYGGSKAAPLQGAGKNEGDAIKGALLEGYNKIPNCSFTDYGASLMKNERTGWYLSAVILAGA